MKTLLSVTLVVVSLPSLLMATGQQVRFALTVHSEMPGGGSNGVPVTPNFTTATKPVYLKWREAIISFAGLCSARGLAWQFQTDANFLEGIRRFEVVGGANYDAQIAAGTRFDAGLGTTTTNTGGKNVVKYLHENLGVNLDPHSHESGGYNYADVAWLIDVGCDTDATLVAGGHVYTGTGYQDWPKFIEDRDGNGLNDGLLASQHAGYYWKPHLLMGAGTSSHVADPHASGLWRPLDNTHYFVDSPTGAIATIGHWEQDFYETDRLLRSLEDNSLPHNDKLWTVGRVMNHRDMVQTGYLTSTAPAILDTIKAWSDAGRFQVKTFEAIYAEWNAAPYNAASSLYERPVDNITFSLNWQDFAYPDKSNAELRTLINHHEAMRVPVDVFLTTWQTDILESMAPDLLGRLFSSRWVNMAYHVRAPKPYANSYTWRSVTSGDITNYETYRLNMVTGQFDTSASGGFVKLTSLYGSAPCIVGPNADTSVSSLVKTYFAGAGAAMIVEHNSAAAVNFGTMSGSLNVRPESYDWKLIELYNGSSPDGNTLATSLTEALAAARTTSGSVAPYFVGVKLHDNDLFSTQSAWTAIYVDAPRTPNWDPYNPAKWPALLETSNAAEPGRRRDIYTGIVTSAAARRTTLNVMDARDTLSMLGDDAARPIGLTFTEIPEEQPAGTVLAEISGGGIESGLQCSYTLVSGTGADDNADFALNGSSLLAARAFDHETTPTRHLRMRWADNAGNSGERALTITVGNVTTDDDDHDGYTEAQEIAAGTDPLNPNSKLAVSNMQVSGNQATLSWSSVAGHGYYLEYSTDLVNWATASGSQVTATSTSSAITINVSGDRMFFRLALQ